MKRVLVLGRGGAGKSTFARRLGSVTRLPVVELDKHYWQQGVIPRSRDEWSALQLELAARPEWILDGDLGPHDLVKPRMTKADTVFVLDYSLMRCISQSLRRGRERRDYWVWVLGYRGRSLPAVMDAITTFAPNADIHVFRTPRMADRFLDQLVRMESTRIPFHS